MSKSHLPIAIFDSGIGGLTVAEALTKLLPHESILYVADTLSRPFGTKSAQQLNVIISRNLELIFSYPIKMLLIACHTACTSESIQILHPPCPLLPIFPTALGLLDTLPVLSSLLIIGTERTIASKIYPNFLNMHYPQLTLEYVAASPLEHLIETECRNPSLIKETVETLLPKRNTPYPEHLFLACTHFPLYRSFIQQRVGPATHILDPAEHFATCVYNTLHSFKLLNTSQRPPSHQYVVTGDVEPFEQKMLYYFGQTLGKTHYHMTSPYAIS